MCLVVGHAGLACLRAATAAERLHGHLSSCQPNDSGQHLLHCVARRVRIIDCVPAPGSFLSSGSGFGSTSRARARASARARTIAKTRNGKLKFEDVNKGTWARWAHILLCKYYIVVRRTWCGSGTCHCHQESDPVLAVFVSRPRTGTAGVPGRLLVQLRAALASGSFLTV